MLGLLALFARWGVAQRLQRPLGYLVLGIGLIALLGVLWAIFDRKNDEAAVTAAIAPANAAFREEQIVAEREAGAAKATRDAADVGDQRDLERKADEATRTGSSSLDAVWDDGLWGSAPGEDRSGQTRSGKAD